MTNPSQAATGGANPSAGVIDTSVPSIARVYDYLLGGKHYYDVDRVASEAMIDAVPETTLLAAANRNFIRRAVRFLVGESGIDQILDIGSGLPTAGNVHEIAQEINPNTRVLYVDKDPIVLANGRALLSANENTVVITADLRDPEAIFENPETQRLLDLSRPLAVILGGILMHIEDEENPHGIVATIRDRLPSGSFLVHSGCADPGEPRARELNQIFYDYNMNVRGKTLNVAYSPRGVPGAPVSMPLTWEELEAAEPTQFTLLNAPARLDVLRRPVFARRGKLG